MTSNSEPTPMENNSRILFFISILFYFNSYSFYFQYLSSLPFLSSSPFLLFSLFFLSSLHSLTISSIFSLIYLFIMMLVSHIIYTCKPFSHMITTWSIPSIWMHHSKYYLDLCGIILKGLYLYGTPCPLEGDELWTLFFYLLLYSSLCCEFSGTFLHTPLVSDDRIPIVWRCWPIIWDILETVLRHLLVLLLFWSTFLQLNILNYPSWSGWR